MAALVTERIDVCPSLLDRPVPGTVRLEALPDEQPVARSHRHMRGIWAWLKDSCRQ